MPIEFDEFESFVSGGLMKWEEVRADFSGETDMADFLKRSSVVVMLDHHQVETRLAKTLYAPTVFLDPEKPKPEEREREKYRKKMLEYYENSLREARIEVRFPTLKIDLIQRLKKHPLAIGNRQMASASSINVVIAFIKAA